MKKIGYISLIIICTAVGATFFVKNVQAARVQILSLSSFVDELIDKGIIRDDKESKAREIVSMIASIENNEDVQVLMNSEYVEVSVNQLIEHSDRTYNKYEDITGLLLLVKNNSDEAVTLEAKRKCQIVYKILDENGKEVYDSGNEERCQTDEKVTYLLQGGQTRMFNVEHKTNTYELDEGTYTIEIEYPGYGGGEKEITIR